MLRRALVCICIQLYPVYSSDTNGVDQTSPRTIIEKLMGQEISRRYFWPLAGEQRKIQCVTPGATITDSNNLRDGHEVLYGWR